VFTVASSSSSGICKHELITLAELVRYISATRLRTGETIKPPPSFDPSQREVSKIIGEQFIRIKKTGEHILHFNVSLVDIVLVFI